MKNRDEEKKKYRQSSRTKQNFIFYRRVYFERKVCRTFFSFSSYFFSQTITNKRKLIFFPLFRWYKDELRLSFIEEKTTLKLITPSYGHIFRRFFFPNTSTMPDYDCKVQCTENYAEINFHYFSKKKGIIKDLCVA